MYDELMKVIYGYIDSAKDLLKALELLETSEYLNSGQELDSQVVDSIIKDLNYCIPSDLNWCSSDIEDIVEELETGTYTLFDERSY